MESLTCTCRGQGSIPQIRNLYCHVAWLRDNTDFQTLNISYSRFPPCAALETRSQELKSHSIEGRCVFLLNWSSDEEWLSTIAICKIQPHSVSIRMWHPTEHGLHVEHFQKRPLQSSTMTELVLFLARRKSITLPGGYLLWLQWKVLTNLLSALLKVSGETGVAGLIRLRTHLPPGTETKVIPRTSQPLCRMAVSLSEQILFDHRQQM